MNFGDVNEMMFGFVIVLSIYFIAVLFKNSSYFKIVANNVCNNDFCQYG
jgi:hypothetical protein